MVYIGKTELMIEQKIQNPPWYDGSDETRAMIGICSDGITERVRA